MKLNDAVWGALFLLLSATVLFHVRNFPTIPGQNVGPALFPGVLATALAACALLLIAKGIVARRSGGERAQWISFDEWVGSPRHVLAFFVVIGVNIFYILLVDRLGFILTGSIYLAVLFAVFGVRMRSILPLALVITLGIHYSFYKLLKVPLPWGLLQGWAW
ncbi:MAG TPA: tripartite tricarboxylate transporter TctB family protein [Casimicrobiaceae bacterium]|nr:tripartite tricarboxylate transporter TctB family protein [Casimicrobiaceae bacterium]